MNIQTLKIDSYKTQMDIKIPNDWICEELSEEYELDQFVKFQIKLQKISNNPIHNNFGIRMNSHPLNFFGSFPVRYERSIQLFAKFINITKNSSIHIQFSSKALNIQDICIKADSKWHLITEKYVTLSKFDVYFTLDVEYNKSKVLYDDDELTDFELRGDDGSVRVHKCMLAASSSVFKTMLQGDWKETRDGYMSLEGISKTTLQEFKQYIYLNTLPSPVSEQILTIAMLYQMPDMEILCINNLISDLKAESVSGLLHFAETHKNDRLKTAISELVQNGLKIHK